MNNLITSKLTALILLSIALGSQPAIARDVCAGAQYNSNVEAQRECPAVCDSAAPVFNGQWTNNFENVEKAGCKAGEESVCGSSAGDICAGKPYFHNDEAQQDCPSVVKRAGEFNGNWTNDARTATRAGCRAREESVCGCGRTDQQNAATTESPADVGGEIDLASEKARLGYVYGYSAAYSLERAGLVGEIDMGAYFAAHRDVLAGREPRITTEEMRALQAALQAKMRARRQTENELIADGNRRRGAAYLASNKSRPGVVTTTSGLQYEVLREGSGGQPTLQDSVLVHYRGALIDGNVFDSSYERGQPANFPVRGVVEGFKEGLQLMKEGGKSRFTIPAELAYGKSGPASIGPDQVLVFEVELIEVK